MAQTNANVNTSQRTPAQEAVFEPQPAQTPTDTEPGSAAKRAVLRARAANGLELWHPEDFTRIPGCHEVSYCNDQKTIKTVRPRKMIG